MHIHLKPFLFVLDIARITRDVFFSYRNPGWTVITGYSSYIGDVKVCY